MKDSTYHPASEELHVKPPATKKQDVLLKDIVLSSRISPPTPMNIFGIIQELPASQDVNNIHVFNDNNNNTVQEDEEEGHPKVMEIAVSKQPTHSNGI